MEKIYIASDHGGYELKQKVKTYLEEKGYDVLDKGNMFYDEHDDYPDFAIPAVIDAMKDKVKIILICKTGTGVCMAANKVKNARAVHGHTKTLVKKAREDEDANTLCLSALHVKEPRILEMIDVFLQTPFSQVDRHKRRIQKIHEFESL